MIIYRYKYYLLMQNSIGVSTRIMTRHINRGDYPQQHSTSPYVENPSARANNHPMQNHLGYRGYYANQIDTPQQYTPPESQQSHDKRKKLAIKVGAGVAGVAAFVAIAGGSVKYMESRNSQETTSSSSTWGEDRQELSPEMKDKFYEIKDGTLDQFNQLSLNEQMSYAQKLYDENAPSLINDLIAAGMPDTEVGASGENPTDKLPELDGQEGAQEILNFMSLTQAAATLAKDARIEYLTVDHTARPDRISRVQEYIDTHPNQSARNIYFAVSDSGFYEDNGTILIDIQFNIPGSNKTTEMTFEKITFNSEYTGEAHTAYRSIATTANN